MTTEPGFSKTKSMQKAVKLCPDYFKDTTLSMDGNETNVFKFWLQNRLREHFLTQEARYFRLKDNDYRPIIKISKFDIMCHELRVLDVKTLPAASNDSEPQYKNNNCINNLQGLDPQKRSFKSDDEAYRTGKTYFSVKYQKSGPSSRVDTIHIVVMAGEIENIDLLDLHPYISYSEKHLIDIYTKVFPMLESWAITKHVKLKLPVPKCYFAKYEDGRKVSVEQIISTENDIMSKIATGMTIDSEIPIFESHRIIILEDVYRNGYERKNTSNSTFLPLLNVQAGLRKIALIHCTSWAFTQITNTSFTTVWPFINHKDYLPYLMTLVGTGFTELMNHVEKYLLKHQPADMDLIITHLHLLNTNLPATLAQITVPSNGPLCLIHQGFNFSTALFRHHLISVEDPNKLAVITSTSLSSSQKDQVTNKGAAKSKNDNKSKQITPSKLSRPLSKNPVLLIEREVCIVDWQNATYGSPMLDIAFMLLTSLPPKTRKAETSALLKLYWDEFEAVANCFGLSIDWTPAEIFKEYLHGLLYSCILISANILPNSQPVTDCNIEIFLEGIRDLIILNVI